MWSSSHGRLPDELLVIPRASGDQVGGMGMLFETGIFPFLMVGAVGAVVNGDTVVLGTPFQASFGTLRGAGGSGSS